MTGWAVVRRSVVHFVTPAVCALWLTGCAHTLEVKNLDHYRHLALAPLPPLAKRPTVTVLDKTQDLASRQIVAAVASELQKHAEVSLRAGTKPDTEFVTEISVLPQYRGRGHNFWINWPGFLVWAPAWHGYIYEITWDMELTLSRGGTPEPIDKFKLPVFLDVRHAAINRTWTEIGWLEYGVIPLVGGVFFTKYDPAVTALVVEKVQQPLGGYVAGEIVKRLARAQPDAPRAEASLGSPPAPPQ